jgi:hypothetical protein
MGCSGAGREFQVPCCPHHHHLTWSKHINTVLKRAQQNLSPSKKICHGSQILKKFYSYTIESILTGSITSWYGNCSASDHKALQGVVRTLSTSLGPSFLPSKTYMLSSVWGRPKKLSKTPVTQVIECSLCYCTASGSGAPSLGPKGSLINSFYPQAIRLLNN